MIENQIKIIRIKVWSPLYTLCEEKYDRQPQHAPFSFLLAACGVLAEDATEPPPETVEVEAGVAAEVESEETNAGVEESVAYAGKYSISCRHLVWIGFLVDTCSLFVVGRVLWWGDAPVCEVDHAFKRSDWLPEDLFVVLSGFRLWEEGASQLLPCLSTFNFV